ncbi:MAG: hypothetical protein OHK0052_21050 [Anaerolineales bacterium]
MSNQTIIIPLKRFLLIEKCPEEWQHLNLYLFRDETVVFYVGQSQLAFARVWEHLLSGFKGHSMVGRFVWSNFPTSLKFNIELRSSQFDEFAALNHNLNAAERALIERYAPCFNLALNPQPTPLPPIYRPYNAPLRCSRNLKKLIYQAERAVQHDETQHWLETLK